MSATQELAQTKAGLPEPVTRRGISESQWRTLFNLFPGGKPDSVLLVWDYCKARQLDPMKKPCHIVPMRVKVSGEWQWRDVVMPGIYEYRITAQRTGLYMGHTEPELGETVDYLDVKAPAWCSMTLYRWNPKAGEKVSFPVKVWFAEVVGTSFDKDTKKDYVNDRWSRAPIQMLTKCTEAAGLREAFPEEIGGEATAEEMEGRQIERDAIPAAAVSLPQAATRRSAAAAPDAPVATPQADAPIIEAEPIAETPPSADPRTGTIVEVKEKSGAFLIKLSTGFFCATRDANMADAANTLKESGRVVELTTTPASDPKFAPRLTEMSPLSRPESEA